MFNSGKRGIFKTLSVRNVAITLAIFLAGGAAFVGINGFFSYTNEMEFCTSCHSMQTNLRELQETVHYKNSSGVRAVCSDCHVPKDFAPKLHAKIVAVKDIYHELVGTVDTEEKFEARRWRMATRVWDKMKATDSRECRSCHDFDNMDFSAQGRMASRRHTRAQAKGQTCIDCHKGIAHTEPLPPEEWEEAEGDADAEETDTGDQ
ncbi:MAG: NapC/NirT family cytochrome c [Gammaproteobacteria bacterium]|nr:NapC/NirT family cytochrome c [Gammaproteobacteria bacterium]